MNKSPSVAHPNGKSENGRRAFASASGGKHGQSEKLEKRYNCGMSCRKYTVFCRRHARNRFGKGGKRRLYAQRSIYRRHAGGFYAGHRRRAGHRAISGNGRGRLLFSGGESGFENGRYYRKGRGNPRAEHGAIKRSHRAQRRKTNAAGSEKKRGNRRSIGCARKRRDYGKI